MLRPFILLLLFLGFPLVARADAAATLAAWQYVQDVESQASFEEIRDFIEHHPTWPDINKITLRGERAMRGANLADSDIIAWFEAHPPVSGVGKWSYAEALSRQQLLPEKTVTLIKEAWRDADLTEEEENTLLAYFGDRLTQEDHRARVDRLLWEGKTTPAMHLIPRLPVKEQVLFEARVSLQHDAKNADFLVGQVVSVLKNDAGLLFDRLQYRLRKKDKAGAGDILLHTPEIVPYPQRWWKIRESEVRRAVAEGNYPMAERLLANHGQADGASFAEALWLSGWIKLEFLHDAGAAYQAFYHMHDAVKTPVSKARAAYWAGRAAKKNGDGATAKNWFRTAAKYPTAFYGQIAASELSETPSLQLPDEPWFGGFFQSEPVLGDDMEQAIRLSIANGDHKTATRLVNHVIARAENEHSMLAVAELGHILDVPHLSVKAAKKAQAQGVVLKNVGYPRPQTEGDLPIERALTLAITRQESEFDPEAESPSGALGMMQLLPGTAKETAKKIDAEYSREQLYDPVYNMRLGSHYLARMLNAYDGSYVFAIASYNAGPGNVRKWLPAGGSLSGDVYDAINWIEKIPFSETRNYVQRVLENVQVYRALEGDGSLKIKEDLVR